MSDELLKKRPDYVRIHDSGDYYSKVYLQKWIDIANLFPEIKFYSYTNSVAMLKEATLPGVLVGALYVAGVLSTSG